MIQLPRPTSKDQAAEPDSFIFPKSIQPGMIFQNRKEFIRAIDKDKDELRLTISKKLYYVKKIRESLRIVCQYCPAAVNAKILQDNKIKIMSVRADHLHTTAKFNDPVEEEIYFMYKANRKSREDEAIREEIMEEFGIGPVMCGRLMRRFEEWDANNFSDLQKWFKDSNCEYRVDWGCEPKTKYPRLLVMATAGMRHNYDRYGDLVAFDITYGLIRNLSSDNRRYRVGFFTVVDTNLRLLLAGITILIDETTEGLIAMFHHFLQIHGKPPQSFVTDDQAAIASAINHLQQNRFFTGEHLLDPRHLLKAIKPRLECSEGTKKAKLDQIMELILERNFHDFQRRLEELKEDTATKEVMADLLKRSDRLFYCDVDSSFIGIRRTNCEEILDRIKLEIPMELTIEDFVKEVSGLDTRLNQRSVNELELMTEPQQLVFNDYRIKEIRTNFEYKVVFRFLENYIKGLRECMIINDRVDDITKNPWFTVACVKSGFKFQIWNWNCPCKEFEKTGVACSHLLLAASNTPDKSYMQFVARRWRKDKPQLNEGALKVQQKSEPAACSGTNIPKQARKQ